MKDTMIKLIVLFLFSVSISACTKSQAKSETYFWQNVTKSAAYPQGYNHPVFVMNGQMFALHNGGWISSDGKNWTKTDLPEIGLNSAYQKYVQFKGSVYALGTMQGNYLNMKLSSKISRTRDFKTWETLAEKSNLPERVFYGAVVFKDKIWLIGGFDGKNYYNDVWNSADGVNWNRAVEKTAWSPRGVSAITVFNNRIFLIGGGVMDGDRSINPNSNNEIWSSEDGSNWTLVTSRIAKNSVHVGSYSTAVFDGKLWMAGVNRNGEFQSGVLFSEDGVSWKEMNAPWSPRGAVAVWVFGNKLFLTGGKSSYVENGETKFVYSNDVWYMSAKG